MDISFIIEFNPKQVGEGGGLAPPLQFFCPSTLIFDTIILLEGGGVGRPHRYTWIQTSQPLFSKSKLVFLSESL